MEATVFARLMSVFNSGNQSSQVMGGYLYDGVGYTVLVLISAALTAVAWFLVPLVRIDRIEVKARGRSPSRQPGERRVALDLGRLGQQLPQLGPIGAGA